MAVIEFGNYRLGELNHLYLWPVFNLADSAIVVGAGLLVVEILFTKRQRTEHSQDTVNGEQ
jgi:lipoprotein signal peptidase